MHAAANRHGTRIVGPNTAGLVTPGECFVGIMPAFVPSVFKPGRVGVISRSGSLGTLVCLNLTRAGLGQSAFIGIGGDPMLGTTTRDALEALDRDDGTDAIVIVGEIGGGMEEAAAEYAKGVAKPMVAFIAGAAAPPNKKMGHAGAIVTGNAGSYAGKAQGAGSGRRHRRRYALANRRGGGGRAWRHPQKPAQAELRTDAWPFQLSKPAALSPTL